MSLFLDHDRLPELQPEEFEQLAELVYGHTGIRLAAGREYFVVDRLGGLFGELGCGSWAELLQRFSADDGGLENRLIRAVITAETSFFRDGLPFRALRDRVLAEVAAKAERPAPLRIWSAGCSTGQEAYSIAMTLWPATVAGAAAPEIWATDVCAHSVQRAQHGEYTRFEVGRGAQRVDRETFFHAGAGGGLRIQPELRRMVRFEQLNLLSDTAPQNAFDVVFCRNVAIYFDLDGKRRLYRTVADALVNGGYLLLGAAEALVPSVPELETLYFEGTPLYRRRYRDPR